MALPESVRSQPLFLIGFSGSGKTSVGERLARRLKVEFADTDHLIEERTGKNPHDIIEQDGIRRFRRLESEVIQGICAQGGLGVIALGGGAFESAANRRLLLQSGTVVYLRCALDELVRRLRGDNSRPLLKAGGVSECANGESLRDRIRSLLEARKENYEKAPVVVSTTRGTLQDQVTDILGALKRHYG